MESFRDLRSLTEKLRKVLIRHNNIIMQIIKLVESNRDCSWNVLLGSPLFGVKLSYYCSIILEIDYTLIIMLSLDESH